MRTPHFLLGCLIAMWLIIGIVVTIPSVKNSTGFEHKDAKYNPHPDPKVSAFRQGGSGTERHGTLLSVCSWAFVCVQTLFFLGCLVLGTQRESVPISKLWPLVAYTVLMIGLLSLLFLIYRRELSDPMAVTFWGAFPASTSIVLYGIWLLPLIVVFFYTLRFDSLIFTPEDEERFHALVQRRRQKQSKTDTEPN